MTASATQAASVVRFRGGRADRAYRLTLGDLREFVAFPFEDGTEEVYRYAGPEEQREDRMIFDNKGRFERRESAVVAVYHVYEHAPGEGAEG